MLRRVEDERPPLDREALQNKGNELVGLARIAAIDAVRLSAHSEFLIKGRTLKLADVRRWREIARDAAKGWQAVESLTTEVLNEISRAKENQ